MTAGQMEKFASLIEKGLDANEELHPLISKYNGAIRTIVTKGGNKRSTLQDVLAAGRKYMKNPRFRMLTATAVISGVLGEAVSAQASILHLAVHSEKKHYEQAIRALNSGDLHLAEKLLVSDDDSLYSEILDKVGFHAATNFKRAMVHAFETARNANYK